MAKSLKRSNVTPLVFSTTGSIGKEGTTFYKRLADRDVIKKTRKTILCCHGLDKM